jgi:transposase InsO family protein
MAYSLDTSSFICCLDRFMNRRGVPATLHSDNGTNFVGAQRQLAECLDNLNQSAIISHLNRKMTKWYFNQRHTSEAFGSVWSEPLKKPWLLC